MIYLDNAATTRIADEVLEEMTPYLKDSFGNPGSLHGLGIEARKAVDLARERVAKLINAEPDEIIFTSGGTEANNLMVHSMSEYLQIGKDPDCNGKIAVSSLTEHDSMIRSLNRFNGRAELMKYYYPVDCCQEIARRGKSGYKLVSMMYVNNEVGFRNPVYEFGKMKINYGFNFISDCVQALGQEFIDVKRMNVDMISMSSHKIHGPKGVGALYVNKNFKSHVTPLLFGGDHQEFGLRGGTENVAGIVGFGKACEMQNVDENKTVILSLKNVLKNVIEERFTSKNIDFRFNFGDNDSKIISLTVKNIDSETLVLLLSSKGVYISAGSACRSLEQKPNRTLLACGISESDARNTVRISLSCYNTKGEIEEAGNAICDCILMMLNSD